MVYLLLATIVFINLAALRVGLVLGVRLPLMVFSGLAVSAFFHYLFLFMHEAAHYNLFAKRSANDLWGNLLVSFWFFKDVNQYRRIHWDHHLKHGQVDDPENSYFLPLTWNNLLRALTGLIAMAKIINWESYTMREKWSRELFVNQTKTVAGFGLYQIGILALFAWYEAWLAYVLVWAVPLVCGFPFLAFVRQVCEHRKLGCGERVFGDVPHGSYTNVFKRTLGARVLGAAGFRQHWYHHFNPHISYTRLDEFAQEVGLALPELTRSLKEVTYLETFLNLVRDARRPLGPSV